MENVQIRGVFAKVSQGFCPGLGNNDLGSDRKEAATFWGAMKLEVYDSCDTAVRLQSSQ